MEKNEIIYLAIPYTWNPEEAFKIANEVAAKLISEGNVIFSPISHSHPIADYMEDTKRCDFDLWMQEDLPILRVCNRVIFIVIGNNGMNLIDNSRGCQKEMREAVITDKSISYYFYEYKKEKNINNIKNKTPLINPYFENWIMKNAPELYESLMSSIPDYFSKKIK